MLWKSYQGFLLLLSYILVEIKILQTLLIYTNSAYQLIRN